VLSCWCNKQHPRTELAVPPVRVLSWQAPDFLHPSNNLESPKSRTSVAPKNFKFSFWLLDELFFVYILHRADALLPPRRLALYDVSRISARNDLKSRPLLEHFPQPRRPGTEHKYRSSLLVERVVRSWWTCCCRSHVVSSRSAASSSSSGLRPDRAAACLAQVPTGPLGRQLDDN
jgi:hypothetical protein